MKNLAIIPARSGSKGLPDKNIINLRGKPLMYYTIKAALESKCFDKVMVSTNSEYYAEIARQCGAMVPFLRTEAVSGDTANSWDVVREVLANYMKLGQEFDYIALLQPTSPLRNTEDIIGIFDMIKNDEIHNAVSIVEVEHPVQWCFRLSKNGSMRELAESPYNYMRRQDLEKHYLENGAVYLVDAKKIMNPEYNFYADNCYGYIMPRERSIDIDTKVDLLVADVYMEDLETNLY